jgi:hypothetical protein
MPAIETIIRQINRELAPQYKEKLRAFLEQQDKEWLIEQIVRLTLDAHSLQEMDRKHFQQEEIRRRMERAERIKGMNLNLDKLKEFVEKYRRISREQLAEGNFLKAGAPPKGGIMITEEFRTQAGNDLLQLAKDMLFALLFGDEHLNIHFNRIQRELLTLTIPRMKSAPLNFMKATTEFGALGTWQDPGGAANDSRADNIVMEIEYGEVESELIGNSIVTALRLINHLEVNEVVLYGRMENIEQSTLVSQRILKI